MAKMVEASPLQTEYGQAVDRDSAYERLAARKRTPAPAGDGGLGGEAPDEGRLAEEDEGPSAAERVLVVAVRSFARWPRR